MSGENALRRADDIGGEALSYAEVKAIASGNPAVLTLAQADAELQRLTVLQKNHADEQYLARIKQKQLPDYIKTLKERLENLTADQATLAAHESDAVTIGGHRCLRDEVQARLRDAIDALPRQVSQARRFPLGVYRGLRFGLTLHPQFPPEVTLEGKAARQDLLPRDHHGPRAVLNALDRLAGNYGAVIATVRQDLTVAEAQLRDFQGRVGVRFAHEEYLSKLTTLRDQLKAALAGLPPEEGIEPVPVAELADRINALKSARTVEAVPERTARRRLTGEEPVTAIIRRQAEAAAAAPAIPPEPAARGHDKSRERLMQQARLPDHSHEGFDTPNERCYTRPAQPTDEEAPMSKRKAVQETQTDTPIESTEPVEAVAPDEKQAADQPPYAPVQAPPRGEHDAMTIDNRVGYRKELSPDGKKRQIRFSDREGGARPDDELLAPVREQKPEVRWASRDKAWQARKTAEGNEALDSADQKLAEIGRKRRDTDGQHR